MISTSPPCERSSPRTGSNPIMRRPCGGCCTVKGWRRATDSSRLASFLPCNAGSRSRWAKVGAFRSICWNWSKRSPAAMGSRTSSSSALADGQTIETVPDGLRGATHRLPQHAGGLCDGLCLLCDGPDGIRASFAARRDRRAGASCSARPACARSDETGPQSRAHGHGRAAPQLRLGDAGARDHLGHARDRDRPGPHRDQHGRCGAGDPPARGGGTSLPPCGKPPRLERGGAGPLSCRRRNAGRSRS
jgi:hypothetical protein